MQNHYPAIDVLRSISRVMDDVVEAPQRRHAGRLKEALATFRKAEDLINIGAYVAGSNPKIDYAIKMIDRINAYLQQDVREAVPLTAAVAQLETLFGTAA